MKLSIIVCVFNERATIQSVLNRLRAVPFGDDIETEILVVDNASTDGTRALLEAISEPNVRVIFSPRNFGKGASLRKGLEQMTGDWAVAHDADLEYDPNDLPRLMARARESGSAAVFGSRLMAGRPVGGYAHTYWGVRLLTSMTNALFGSRLTDVGTCYKLVRRDAVQSLHLECTGFEIDFELVNKLLLAGHSIEEVPIGYTPRTYNSGKKIKVADGLRGLWVVLRDRLALSPVHKA